MIKFKNLCKDYEKKHVLKNVNMQINEGELVAIIGESGCGKTTMLKTINNLVKPTRGAVIVEGENVTDKKTNIIKLRRNIGYVVQSTGLFPHLTIKQNIEIIPKIEKRSKEKIAKRTLELMEMINLPAQEYLSKYPTQLSGGQQQRIGVARAFALDPKIILMDEPFSALDPITRQELQDELIAIQAKAKKTIVFVTHDMDEAVKIADKICIMKDGEILQYDTPENILKNPINEFVESFVGKNRIWNSPELIKVEDIMITDPITAKKGITVMRALDKMRTNKVDSLLIIGENKDYQGAVFAKTCIAIENKSILIDEIIKTEHPTINPNFDLLQTLKIVNECGKSTLPVVDEQNQLVGLITKSSLVTVLAEQYIDFGDANIFNDNIHSTN